MGSVIQKFASFMNTLPAVLLMFATGLSAEPIGLNGEAIYMKSCITCHGDDGEGAMPGVPDLTTAGGAMDKPSDILVRNTVNGMQSQGSPMPMPPKGGNPELSESNIRDVIVYMSQTFGKHVNPQKLKKESNHD